MKPFNHGLTSVARFGGSLEDYIEIHNFIDSSKSTYAHAKHRSIFHNEFGVQLVEQLFGKTIINSQGKEVLVKEIAEEHIKQDMGGIIPTAKMWSEEITTKGWMIGKKVKRIISF